MERDELTGLPIGGPVDVASAGWPDVSRLDGRYVQLEALDANRHADGLWNVVGGADKAALWQYMPEGPFLEKQEFEAAVRGAADHADPVFFVILDKVTHHSMGRCALLNIRPTHRVVEVGHILFSAELQRTPAATEALYLLAKYAFEGLGYRRYEWKCNALNAKSRSAALRLGFEFEGIFRQHMIVKGRNRDSAWFAMLDRDWPSVKGAMETWLAPENFDAQGQQRLKLSDLMSQR